VFTEEELAGASADIQAHSMASASSSRPGRSFNKPFRAMPKQCGIISGGGGGGGGTSLSSAVPMEEKKESRRNSLSQPPFKPQHEMPKEEDLNNWSHHFSVETIEDEYLKKATIGSDLVSFVFGLNVTWDLTQKQTALDDQREAEDKERKDNDLELAKTRLGGSLKKRKKSGGAEADKENQVSSENIAEVEDIALDADVEEVLSSGDMEDDVDDDDDELAPAQEAPQDASEKDVIEKEQNMMEAADSEVVSSSSKISCEVCTFMNKVSAKKCEVIL
jgi:hypothetical protein